MKDVLISTVPCVKLDPGADFITFISALLDSTSIVDIAEIGIIDSVLALNSFFNKVELFHYPGVISGNRCHECRIS